MESIEPSALLAADCHCPYCGEPLELLLDTSAGDQAYVEDCQVCCRPMEVRLTIAVDGSANWQVMRGDE